MITHEDVGAVKFKYMIIYLDCALTGKKFKDCEHTFKNSAAKLPMDFKNGELYYLSDGGYSRIKFYGDGIGLVSGSRTEVKMAWSRCHELIQDINEFIFNLKD